MIRPLGVPYGPSIIDDLRKYGVECPACSQIFMAPEAKTEDEMTKGAAALYAVHYEHVHHDEEE